MVNEVAENKKQHCHGNERTQPVMVSMKWLTNLRQRRRRLMLAPFRCRAAR